MVPVQEILKTNMGDRVPGEIDIHTGPLEEDSDPEVEEGEEMEPSPESEMEPTPAPEPVSEMEQTPVSTLASETESSPELKDISLERREVEEVDDDDTLFPSAPER